jgi:hypothetical protein
LNLKINCKILDLFAEFLDLFDADDPDLDERVILN